jgi:carbonic anhydrase
MQKLIAGIHQFQTEIFGTQRELFERLTGGQRPDALFITCSDSRINPNLITQTEPGELFILRNAGNIVPRYDAGTGGEAATIEFAVAALGICDIIVCGHSHCGAMQGVVYPERLAGLPAIGAWLQHAAVTRKIISERYRHLEGSALLTATAEENVLVQLENLRTHPAVADRIGGAGLRLHGWVYKIETGEVFDYDPASGQFVPLAAPAAHVPHAKARPDSDGTI